MFGRLAALVLDRRLAIGVVAGLVILACTAGILSLGVDFSARAFFGADDPETAYLDDYLARWGEDDVLVVVVDGGGETVLTEPRLRVVDALARALEADDEVSGVRAATDMPRMQRGLGGTWLPVPLLSTVGATRHGDEGAERWRESLLADPALVPTFLSEDGRYASVLVQLAVSTDDLVSVRPTVRRIDAIVSGFQGQEGLNLLVAGIPSVRADVLDAIYGDQIVLVPVAALLMALLLLVMFRSKHGVIIPAVAAAVPTGMLLGIMGWTGEPIGLLNQVFPVLVPVIAVADGIHLLGRYHEEANRLERERGAFGPAERREATIETMRHMGLACFLTSFTTIIGFMSLYATQMPVLRGFGVYAGLGIALAYATVLVILPLALSLTRFSARRPRQSGQGAIGGALVICARWATRYPERCLAGALVVTLLAGAGGTLVRVDTKLSAMFSEKHRSTRTNAVVDAHLGGVMTLEFDLESDAPVFDRVDVLRSLEKVEDLAAHQDGVRATFSPASVVATVSRNLGGPAEVPADPALLGRLLELGDRGGILRVILTEDRERGRLILRAADLGASRLSAVGETVGQALEQELGPFGVRSHLTGTSYVAYRGLTQVTHDLRTSLLGAFLVIGAVLAILFRDPRIGLLSLVPNVVPLLFGYGVIGVLGWNLDPAPAVVFTVALGLSVDDTIHLLARFREEVASGHTPREAAEQAILHSGRAVTVTSVILGVGFGVNALSSFPANAIFGWIGMIIRLGALVCNLIVLPALLVWIYGLRQPRSASTA